jgi:colanic acid biosynthesis glycosyl transferase WcaI
LRILVYGLNFAPELTGIGKYTGEMAAWLAGRGHEVRVVTAPPYYPAWRIREDYRGRWYRTERGAGEPVVIRTPLYVPERPSGMSRVAHLFSFMVGSVPAMALEVFRRPEVVFTVEPTFFCAPLALFVAKAAGVPAWLHVQDFEVDAAFELGLLPSEGWIHDIALRLEGFFTLAFDRVSSISAKMMERAQVKGVAADQVVLFPNWVDVDSIYPLEECAECDAKEPTALRRELSGRVPGIESKTLLLYSGNMGAKQGLELLAPLAKRFAGDPRVHFVFCGDGSFRPQLEEMVRGMANVTLMPLQPFDRLNDLLNTADIHLLPQRAGAADLVMPSRLTGMLASGRPVIATAAPGTQVAMVVEGRGLAVPAEDPEALYSAVDRLVKDRALRAQMGRAARAYAVEHLGKEQVLTRFEADLNQLVAQS